MGSFDGAKCCDIVGLSLPSPLQGQGLNVGMYQEDLLAASRLTKLQNKIAEQMICRIFAADGLEITGTEANKKTVEYLDVTLEILTESYRLYIVHEAWQKYIHRDSDHPPSIIRAIPKGVNSRLSRLSSR